MNRFRNLWACLFLPSPPGRGAGGEGRGIHHRDSKTRRIRVSLIARRPSPQPSPRGRGGQRIPIAASILLAGLFISPIQAQQPVDATTIHGKVLCGYQGWFRCPGDAADMGWVHWGRDPKRLTPRTLTVEMWPDLSEFPPSERFPAPDFTLADGKAAELFSSDHPATVLRHFEWMRDYGIDGIWLQHFVVDLPGGPIESRFPSRSRVLDHVRTAATKTGRTWAITFDLSGTPADRAFDILAREWKRLVDAGITADPRYLHEKGKPVVQVWGHYRDRMTPEQADRYAHFFHQDGPYAAYLVGGGDWNWRRHPDREWQAALGHLDAYAPWNIGNYAKDRAGQIHAQMNYWAEDKKEAERRGVHWLPVVYPGFGWDNLQRKAPGTSTIPRDKGRFLWEQFHELAKLGADGAFVAMFDEVDEGTAIFKVTNEPPQQAHFLTYDGLPTDWYLRLTGEGARMLRKERPISAEIPIKP